MTDLIREYAERWYAQGGEWADIGQRILELCDVEEAFDELVYVVGDDPKTIRKQLDEHEAIGAIVDEIDDRAFHESERLPTQIKEGLAFLEAIRVDYEAITDALEDIGVLQPGEQADIPAILRLLIAPA